jgi:hypothetical protein
MKPVVTVTSAVKPKTRPTIKAKKENETEINNGTDTAVPEAANSAPSEHFISSWLSFTIVTLLMIFLM